MERSVGKWVRFLVTLLLIAGTLIILLVVAISWNDTLGAQDGSAENGVAQHEPTEASLGEVALDAAVLSSLLAAFDKTELVRSHAIHKTRTDLKAIRINTGRLARREAPRLAQRMLHPTMIPRLGYAYGMDVFTEGDRVWTLFDEAMGPGMVHIAEIDADSYAKQLTHHRRDLLTSQAQFGAKINSAVEPLGRKHATSVPALSNKGLMTPERSRTQKRILTAIWTRLRTRYPNMLRRGAVKFGIKEAKRVPGAAIDGPLPIVETGLIMWGLYDVAGTAASGWRAAHREIADATIAEADRAAQSRLESAAQQFYAIEKEGRVARCAALAASMELLSRGDKAQEYERRCS